MRTVTRRRAYADIDNPQHLLCSMLSAERNNSRKMGEVTAIKPKSDVPLLGVLAMQPYLREHLNKSPGSVPNLNMLSAKEAGVSAFYFSLGDVRIHPPVILGATHDALGNWTRDWFPWPQVLYLQFGYPRNRGEKFVLRRLLQQVTLVNSRSILSKWLCHQVLVAAPSTAGCLPEMHRLRSPGMVVEMLRRHHGVYIKPDQGSRGRGIFRVVMRQSGCFGWASSTGDTGEHTYTRTQLLRRLARLPRRKFVLQAEVPLFQMVDGRRADVRALVQKDGAGDWVVEYVGLRVGKPGSIVTNSHQGGEWLLFEQADERTGWTEETRRELEDRLVNVSPLMARHLEEGVGPMGEIGLDLAFDLTGNVWLIEANAQPDKTEIHPTGRTSPKYTRVMEYAKYLLGQAVKPADRPRRACRFPAHLVD